MKDFMNTLFAYKYFPEVLGMIIIILIIAFLVVYYLGKKDQKLIETRKLEKISDDTIPKEIKENKEDTYREDNNILEKESIIEEKDAFKEISPSEKFEVQDSNIPKETEEKIPEIPEELLSIPQDNYEEPKLVKEDHFEPELKEVIHPLEEDTIIHEQEEINPEVVPRFNDSFQRNLGINMQREINPQVKPEIQNVQINEQKEVNPEVFKDKKEDYTFDNTSTIEFPKLNSNTNIKTVSIDDFERISDSIDKKIENLEKLEEERKEKTNTFFENDGNDIELPKLK